MPTNQSAAECRDANRGDRSGPLGGPICVVHSQCLRRTVSLKQEGGGNPGHGGYAVQMTYQAPATTGPIRIVVDQETTSDGGFGYFVSHERYRTFTDQSSNTIAGQDFPCRQFAARAEFRRARRRAAADRDRGGVPHPHDLSSLRHDRARPRRRRGRRQEQAAADLGVLARYALPVTLTWVFEAQTDAPRYDVDVDLTEVGEADRVGFDLRAPYGVMVFDDGKDGLVTQSAVGRPIPLRHLRQSGDPRQRLDLECREPRRPVQRDDRRRI